MREYIQLIQADKQAHEARLRTASPMMLDLARKLQRAAFQDAPAAPCHISDIFTPAPIYLAQADAILSGAVDLSDEVGAGSIVGLVSGMLDKILSPRALMTPKEFDELVKDMVFEPGPIIPIPPEPFTIPTNWSIYHADASKLWYVQVDYGPTTRRYAGSTIAIAVTTARRGEA